MKIIAYILALTVLGLSVYPCSDGLHCETLPINTSHKKSEHEKDSCSPFCACCGLTYTESEIKLTLPKVELQISIINFYYSFNYSFSYQRTVWHPPVYCQIISFISNSPNSIFRRIYLRYFNFIS